jgi:hypothetical protein
MEGKLKDYYNEPLCEETRKLLAKTHRWLAERYAKSFEDLEHCLPRRAGIAKKERDRHLAAAEKMERFL